jgi:hypothetical protein
MIFKLPDDMRQMLERNPGQPVTFEDEQTHKLYVLLAQDDVSSLWDNYLRREVARGLDAVDRGEVVEWDPERIKAAGREILAQRGRQPE